MADTGNFRQVKILNFDYFRMPQDKTKPYCVTLDVRGDGVGQVVPMEVNEFFKLLNSLVIPRVEACGNEHVPTVNVPVVQLDG